MPDLNPPMPVWSVKFFRDLRSQAPARIGYVSRGSEAEVEKLALERMGDEEACRRNGFDLGQVRDVDERFAVDQFSESVLWTGTKRLPRQFRECFRNVMCRYEAEELTVICQQTAKCRPAEGMRL